MSNARSAATRKIISSKEARRDSRHSAGTPLGPARAADSVLMKVGSLVTLGQTPSRLLYDAIVVGGGFAGLIASRELRLKGRSVALVEARARLGGRTWWKEKAIGGLSVEMGGTWIDPRQSYSWAEAIRYGVEIGPPLFGAPPNLWIVDGLRVKGFLPVPLDRIGELERVVRAIGKASERIDPSLPLYEQAVSDLDVSIDDFLADIPSNREVRRIAATYLGAYGSADSRDVSALHLLRRVAAAGSFAEFVFSGESHPLVTGTASLAQAIHAESGVEVLFGSPVSRVEQARGKVTVYAGDHVLRARTCVLCLPVNVLKDVDFQPALSAAKLAISSEELACTGTKVWMVARHVPPDLSACGQGAGLHMVWVDRRLDDDAMLLVGYGPDADALDISDRRAVETALRSFVPHAEVLECAGHDWRHDPFSKETWAVFRPGQITRYERALRKRERRLIFGGSHTALRWPGFIDGAIESGFRVAAEADELLGMVQQPEDAE
jgi:monoamine oxidase